MRSHLRVSTIAALTLGVALTLTGCVGHADPDSTATPSASLAPLPVDSAKINGSATARDALGKIIEDSLSQAVAQGYTQVGTNDSLTLTTVFDPKADKDKQEATLSSNTGAASLAYIDSAENKYAAAGALSELQKALGTEGTVVEQYSDGSFRMQAPDAVPVTVMVQDGRVSMIITEYDDRGRWVDTFVYEVSPEGKKILADAVKASEVTQPAK